MRIIAGSARGRALKGPQGPGLRPTADRVKESIFNILGQWMDGLVVLDLFAGTGALALEALSRGASSAVLVDGNHQSVSLCRHNIQALGMDERAQVVQAQVDSRLLKRISVYGPFDLVFADPPYAVPAGDVLHQLSLAEGLWKPEGRLVLEHDRRSVLPDACASLRRVDGRVFGDTAITFYSRS